MICSCVLSLLGVNGLGAQAQVIEDFAGGRAGAFDHLVQKAARDADLVRKARLRAGSDNAVKLGEDFILR